MITGPDQGLEMAYGITYRAQQLGNRGPDMSDNGELQARHRKRPFPSSPLLIFVDEAT